MKKPIVVFIIISILLTANLSSINSLIISNGTGVLENGAEFSWEETRFVSQINYIFEDEIFVMQDSGIDYYIGEYTNSYIDIDNETGKEIWVEVIVNYTVQSNFTYFQNNTMTGNITITSEFDVYQVNVSYLPNLQLIWMALKNGSLIMEGYIYKQDLYYEQAEKVHRMYEVTRKKYNLTTMEYIGEEYDTYDEYDEYNYSSDDFGPDPYENSTWYSRTKYYITMPLFLIMQFYTTTNNERVALATTLVDYIVYNDTDMNGIYSAGEKIVSGTPTAPNFNLYYSDEFRGNMYPGAAIGEIYNEVRDRDNPEISTNWTTIAYLPKDKTVEEIAKNITFTPPVQNMLLFIL